MKFLDLNGLKHLLTKIKTSFDVAITPNSKYIEERDDLKNIMIPFVANHQIVTMDTSSDINVYNWYENAPEGGILDIVFAGARDGHVYCNYQGKCPLFKMCDGVQGPKLTQINHLPTDYNTYARLIKSGKLLIVAEFVTNN